MAITVSKEDRIRQLILKKRECMSKSDGVCRYQKSLDDIMEIECIDDELAMIVSKEIFNSVFINYEFDFSEIELITETLLEMAKNTAIVR